MDGGLTALRLRQRRKREEERRKRRAQQANKRGGTTVVALSPSTSRDPSRVESFAGSPGRSVGNGRAGNGGDDDDDDIQSVLPEKAAALRRRRLEAERERKNKEEGMELIRKLYPDLVPPAPKVAAIPSKPSPSAAKRPPSSPDAKSRSRSAAEPKRSKRSGGVGGDWVSRPSKKRPEASSDDKDDEKKLASEPRQSKPKPVRVLEGDSQESGSSQDSGSAPVHSIHIQEGRLGGYNASQVTNPPSPVKPKVTAARGATSARRHPSPSKTLLFGGQRRSRVNSDSSDEDLVALGRKLAKKKAEERKRRNDEDDADTGDLTRTAKRLERREKERREREARQKRKLEELREKTRKQQDQMDGGEDDYSTKKGALDGEVSVSPAQPYRRRLYESDSDEDLVALSRKLIQQKKEKEEKERKRNPITMMQMKEEEMKKSMDTFTNSAKRKKRRSEGSQRKDDEQQSNSPRLHDDSDGENRKKTSLTPENRKSRPEVEDAMTNEKLIGLPAKSSGKKVAKAIDSDLDDDIWDEDSGSDRDSIVDSDADDDLESTRRGRKTKPGGWNHKRQRRQVATGGSRQPRPGRKRPRPVAAPLSPSKKNEVSDLRSLLDSHYDSARSESDEDDEELRNKLCPHFENPKLGVGPLEKLELELPEAQEDRGPLCRVPYSGEEGASVGSGDADDKSNDVRHYVPASINRYLQPYQREGIAFVHSLLVRGKGCILGDDMGLGKTVQIISVIAALQGKTGTAMDERAIKMRQRRITGRLKKEQERKELAMMTGDMVGARGTPSKGKAKASEEETIDSDARAAVSGRIIIIVPSSVVKNWSNEFEAWGYFPVSFYQGEDRSVSLDRVKHGLDDVLVVSRSLFSRRGKGESKGPFEEINSLKWRLAIVDEFHEYKNHKSIAYDCLAQLRTDSRCPVVGMTGTVLQNNYQELWNLIDLVQPGLLGSWKEFQLQTAKPLMLMRTKTAQDDIIELGKRRQSDLDRAMKHAYLQRYKKDVLRDELTEKKEQVIFCPLSDVQKSIYRQVMCLPDYHLLRSANAPCDCGVNRRYFIGYKKMRNKREQIHYEKTHKKDLVRMKDCCYRLPYNPRKDEADEPLIDPDAVIWRNMHCNDQECTMCPTCILLPALQKLYKVSSHAALLQAEHDPNRLVEDTPEWKKARKELEFAQVALPGEVLPSLPGGGYLRHDGIMDDHMALSGKMKRLDEYLRFFSRGHNRVLIFSYSTKTLDLIQHYVRAQGHTFRRLDGKTPTRKRQAMIDEFQRDDTIFLFLISTKAGGLGLNLTAANKVIVFDVNWNPSLDEQAQDRAFRIGQNRDVEVVRLVAQGTVEELMYIRQIYKVHLKMQALGNGKTDDVASEGGGAQPRIFRGVAGDKTRKGELFGLENLLKFKDGSFMAELWTAKEKAEKRGGSRRDKSLGIVDVSEVTHALSSMTDDQIDLLGDERVESTENEPEKSAVNHDDFMWENRGGALLKPGDDGFEEEMGGASQIVHVMSKMACEKITIDDDDSIDSERNKNLSSAPAIAKPKIPKKQLETVNEATLYGDIDSEDTDLTDLNSRAQHPSITPVKHTKPVIVAKSADAPEKQSPASPVKTVLLGKLPADRASAPKPNLLGILYVPSYSKKKKKRRKKGTVL